MEDRITPYLYLEITNRPAEDYAHDRLAQVLHRDGAHRGSWWTNCVPDRESPARRMPDFTTLGLYECDERFTAPDAPDDITGLLYRHCPRPGQGTMSDQPTLGLEIVLFSPIERAHAQELRDWCDFVHIHDIAAAQVEQFTMITPYENVNGRDPLYLHVYELITDDPEPAYQNMVPATAARIGAWNTHPYDEWIFNTKAAIDYVSTFSRQGITLA